ncbi:MAG TPA: GNAT family N-acetyltransferase [Pseudonocardia sp.]|nr:GNAT family N-acetyltransferase [Pseudonocardia sp.]
MDLEVRPLAAADLDLAARVLRDAFTAYLGVDLLADTDLLRSRHRARHTVVLAAYRSGQPVGTLVATGWGSVGLLGPVAVAPRLWGQGIGSRLVEAGVAVLDGWGATHQGLFTYADSPRHHVFYQRLGFWPRFLTAVMSAPVTGSEPAAGQPLSTADAATRRRLTTDCASITDALRPGLDLTGEIDAALDGGLGEVLVVGGARPTGFAICHSGPGTEAGTGVAYVKFAAARPGPGAPVAFAALVGACRGYAARAGARRLTLGVNTARREAYRWLIAAGMRTDVAGVTMHRPDAPGYDRPYAHVLDDWR